MSEAPKPPIRSWSFSVLKDYESCPYRVFLAKVQRVKEEIPDDPDHPLVRGERVHKEAEDFIRGMGPMTKELKKFKPQLEALAEKFTDGVIEVEQEWGFDENWGAMSWSAPECWLRVKCDVVEHLSPGVIKVTDWKTGKSFGKEVAHRQQAQLYGLSTFLRYQTADIVEAEMAYLDEGKSTKQRYRRDAIVPLLKRWEERAKRMTGALTFPPKPNRGNCRFCPYGTNVGNGACAYAAATE